MSQNQFPRVRWQNFGGGWMLVTESGGAKVVLCAGFKNSVPSLQVRDADGVLRELVPDHEDAARLRDCWNACEGIEDPAKLREQRDELLNTLVRAFHWVMTPGPDMNNGWTQERLLSEIKATVAKVEDGK